MGSGRILSFLGVAWLGLVATAALRSVWPLSIVPAPDVPLLVVMFAALGGRGGPAGVIALAASAGYLSDLASGAPKGTYLLAFSLLALLGRELSSRVLVRGIVPSVVAAVVASLLLNLSVLGLRDVLGSPVTPASLLPVPLSVLVTAVASPFVFGLLARIDAAFLRGPRGLRAAG